MSLCLFVFLAIIFAFGNGNEVDVSGDPQPITDFSDKGLLEAGDFAMKYLEKWFRNVVKLKLVNITQANYQVENLFVLLLRNLTADVLFETFFCNLNI